MVNGIVSPCVVFRLSAGRRRSATASELGCRTRVSEPPAPTRRFVVCVHRGRRALSLDRYIAIMQATIRMCLSPLSASLCFVQSSAG